jgi:transposase InsO family protein
MAQENSGWGYDRIVGALANLGHQVSDQTVGNILKRHGIAPAPKHSQKTTWKEFISAHMAVLAGTDFFTVEVLTWRGLVTYYVLFFLNLESRRVTAAGMTRHPTEAWMIQMARNAVDETSGCLCNHRYLLHDRDAKFCAEYDDVLRSGGVHCLTLPPRSPNLNAFAERWVRSVKEECLFKLVLFGEGSLHRALNEFIAHFSFGDGTIKARERSPVPLPDQNNNSPKGPLPRTPRWSASVLLMRGLIVDHTGSHDTTLALSEMPVVLHFQAANVPEM